MPFGATHYVENQVAAKAMVTAVVGNVSRVTLDPANAEIADGALAFPTRLPFGKRAVALEGATAAAVIKGNRFVEAAQRPEDAIATLRAKDGKLSVFDAEGVALTNPVSDDGSGREYIGEVLEGLARSNALRLLPAGGLPGAVGGRLGPRRGRQTRPNERWRCVAYQ